MWLVPKNNPKIIEFRKWVAHRLVRYAQHIYPPSEAVMAFHMSLLHDMMINGVAITRINPNE